MLAKFYTSVNETIVRLQKSSNGVSDTLVKTDILHSYTLFKALYNKYTRKLRIIFESLQNQQAQQYSRKVTILNDQSKKKNTISH